MGTLRFFLALSVVWGHSGLISATGFPMVPGDTAVETFYVISGFYMALVLNESYRPKNSTYLLFIANRFARLWPSYGVVVMATLILAWFVGQRLPFVAYWHSLDVSGAVSALLAASQVSLVGIDLTQFLTLRNGPLADSLVIPPAWTLGVELWFYLVAPFIVRRSTPTIVVVLFASIALRLVLQFAFGLSGDPWSYRFFPSELAFFLTGALGYQVYRPTGAHKYAPVLFGVACVCSVIAVVVNRWHGLSRVASASVLLLFLLALPALFRRTKSIMFDRALGELSYPIYICHFLVIWSASLLFGDRPSIAVGIVVLLSSVLIAAVLFLAVDRPIDAWRHRALAPKR